MVSSQDLMECGCDTPVVPSAVCLSVCLDTTIVAADWLIKYPSRLLDYYSTRAAASRTWLISNTHTAGAKHARDMSHDSETVH